MIRPWLAQINGVALAEESDEAFIISSRPRRARSGCFRKTNLVLNVGQKSTF